MIPLLFNEKNNCVVDENFSNQSTKKLYHRRNIMKIIFSAECLKKNKTALIFCVK